jgi:hypothetical protein
MPFYHSFYPAVCDIILLYYTVICLSRTALSYSIQSYQTLRCSAVPCALILQHPFYVDTVRFYINLSYPISLYPTLHYPKVSRIVFGMTKRENRMAEVANFTIGTKGGKGARRSLGS